MRSVICLTLFWVGACAPNASDSASGDSEGSGEPAFATQTDAPTPDYRKLLAEKSLSDSGWVRREATSAPPPDAKSTGRQWIERLESRHALNGYGLGGKDQDSPVTMIDTGMTESDFDQWVKANGWSVPTHIAWSFVPEMELPRVSQAARNGIRVWPASTARTGAQNEALLWGRVELRDGCFYAVEGDGTPDKLAFFHEEIGLDVDREGFYILRDRISGRTLARIGEPLNWGGPPSAYIAPELEREIREKCGPGEILVVGSPESRERFATQYPHIRDMTGPPPPGA